MVLLVILFFIYKVFIEEEEYSTRRKKWKTKKGKRKTYKDKYGYLRYKDSRKSVHRSIVEKKYGRKLGRDLVVHHKNRNKLDNRISNLEVMTHEEHDAQHRHDAKKHGKHSYTGYTKDRVRFDKKDG